MGGIPKSLEFNQDGVGGGGGGAGPHTSRKAGTGSASTNASNPGVGWGGLFWDVFLTSEGLFSGNVLDLLLHTLTPPLQFPPPPGGGGGPSPQTAEEIPGAKGAEGFLSLGCAGTAAVLVPPLCGAILCKEPSFRDHRGAQHMGGGG